MKIALVLTTSLVTIALYDLLRNVLALLLEGKPKELWLLDALKLPYAQDLIFATLVVLFVVVSLWFVVDFCIHFAKHLLQRRQLGNQCEQAEQDDHSPQKAMRINWLILGSLMVTLTSLLLYLPFVGGLPGGDTSSYVGLMHGLENHGVLWSLYSQKRPLVSLIFYLLHLAVPNPDYLAGITLTTTAYILLSSCILSWFSLSLLRKLGAGRFSSLLCVFTGYVIWIFRFSGDLYANYLAYALMYAFAYFYINVLEGKKLDGLLSGIILSLMFFIHEETAYVTVVIAALSFLVQLGYDKDKLRRVRFPVILWFFTTSAILLPFLSLTLIDPNYLGIFSTKLGPVEERYGSFATLSAFWGSEISLNNYNIVASKALLSGFPNIVGYCLILLGMILTCLAFHKRRHESGWGLLQSWFSILLAGIMIGSVPPLIGTPHALSTVVWRLALLMPVPLLLLPLVDSALTFSRSFHVKVICRIHQFTNVRIGRNELRLILIGVLVTATISSLDVSIQYKFYYSGSPRPSESTIQDALAIRSIFGYGNQSVILYVQNNEGRKVEWISALTGMNVFYGRSILDLHLGIINEQLSNDVVYIVKIRLLQKAGVFGNLNEATIVTAETFVMMDPIESELISVSINNLKGSQIYIFKDINKEEAQRLYELRERLYDTNLLLGDSLNGEGGFWKAYRGIGGNWEVVTSQYLEPPMAYNITLTDKGTKYIRLYHLFEEPINFTRYSYLRFIVDSSFTNCPQKNLRLLFGLDIIAGGATKNYGSFEFVVVSEERSVIIVPLKMLEPIGEFDLAKVRQIVLRLDDDNVVGTIYISELRALL